MQNLSKKSSSENRRELNAKQREYERLSKRTAELNALFKRLYEDNVLGRINNEQFRMLSCGYTDEQKSIDAKLPELEKQIQNLQQAASDSYTRNPAHLRFKDNHSRAA